MTADDNGKLRIEPRVTRQDVERVLALGRLLMSVLTPEELDQLQDAVANGRPFRVGAVRSEREIGNAGVP